MDILTENLGKKFRNEWIFKAVNLHFKQGEVYTFTGSNGSGKSTLLQVLSGYMPASEGTIQYSLQGEKISPDDIFKHIVIAAPYLELIEEFTLTELLAFHTQFKPLVQGYTHEAFIDFIELPRAKNKAIKHFSSGMKQRVKLGLAFLSESAVLMLDEPSSNLDRHAIAWYSKNVQIFAQNRLTFICSNQPEEYTFCPNIYNIMDYKSL